MNLIVWGVGREYANNKNEINSLPYRLIDVSEKKQGLIVDGIKVENPNILFNCQYDYIVISTTLYYGEIHNRLINEYHVPSKKIICIKDAGKEILMREIGKYKLQKCYGPKILFGYCFLIYENCRIHDYLLAESLRLRGAEIIPAVCGGVQELQCGVYGGEWGNKEHGIDKKRLQHRHNCKICRGFDEKVWMEWGNYNLLSAWNYLTKEEKKFAEAFIQKLDIELVQDWTYNDFPIGKWGLTTYFNIMLISHKEKWMQSEEEELRYLVYNIVLMCIASWKMVNDIEPDIIYSNDSFYYPYSILETIAKKKGIAFYNAYGFRKGTYTYAMNASTLSMQNLDSAWRTFSKRKMTDAEEIFISKYVSNRSSGVDMLLNTASPWETVREIKTESIYGKIDRNKKTALMATNVTWDAAALCREIVFPNIIDWILYTVDWFVNHSEWQLIVRAHPAEINKLTPEAHERICSIILKKYQNRLPDNIILIDGDAPIKVYDLFDITNLGLVYTSTVGLEMCCNGIPVIVAADAPYRDKGFTYDPANLKEYEKQLEECVEGTDIDVEKMKLQAKKFFLLYYFIYMLPNPFYSFTYERGAKLTIETPEELMPGKNEIWDYICNSVLQRKAVISEDRIPPYELRV